MNDRELGEDGIRRDPRMTETAITRLYAAAAEVTDDLAKQSEIVTLCVVADVDADELRYRAGLRAIEKVEVEPDNIRRVLTHHPHMGGKVPSRNPNGPQSR